MRASDKPGLAKPETLTSSPTKAELETAPATPDQGAAPGQRADYLRLIDELTPDSTTALEKVCEAVVLARLSPYAATRAAEAIKSKTGHSLPTIRSELGRAARAAWYKNLKKQDAVHPATGKRIFRFDDEFHFDEARDFCVAALHEANKAAKIPIFCCLASHAANLRAEVVEGYEQVRFEEMDPTRFWSELCHLIAFVQRREDGDGARGKVPEDVARAVYNAAFKYLPKAPEVLRAPVFLSDGSLVVDPGYHFDEDKPELLNILLVIDEDVVVPRVSKKPTIEEVKESVTWIRTELLHDFPFMDADNDGTESRAPSEANAFAMILTPFMRRMINGRTPVFFIEKPTPGTGGTLLGQMPMWLFDGQAGSVTRYSKNEEEMQKGLVAAVMEPRSHLFFDDVSEFNNRELLRAITQGNITGRILGRSENVSVPNRFNWIATGNNTRIGDEMRRRTVFIRLNAKRADVNKRKFRHPDHSGFTYEAFVRAHRGIAIHHILTMIQYWISTGMQPFTERRRASFEDWSARVGGVLQACGIEGFIDNFDNDNPADMNDAEQKQFVREFFKKYGAETVQPSRGVFEWAVEAGLDIITGKNDDMRRTHFVNWTLRLLHGRTFCLEESSYMFKQSMHDDGNLGCVLIKLVDVP